MHIRPPSAKSFSTKAFLLPILPLLAGGGIYVLWRSPSLLMFQWFDSLGLSSPIFAMRVEAAGLRPHLPVWFLYSLPDAAWVSCGMLLFAAIWSGSRNAYRHFWVALPLLLSIVAEYGQLLHLIPGTYDLSDVVASLSAGGISYFVAHHRLDYAI